MKNFAFAAAAAVMSLTFACGTNAAVIYTAGDGDYSLTFTAGAASDAVSFGMWNPPSYTYISNISLVDTTTGGANILDNSWQNLGGPDYCCSGAYDDGSQAGGLVSGSFAPYTVFQEAVNLTAGDSYALSFTVSNSDGYTQYGAVNGAVPEPNAWLVMLAGFGLAGAALRGRRKALAV